MCRSPQYSVSLPKKQCRCEKRHGRSEKGMKYQSSQLVRTPIYNKSNVLRCFSECHPHHGPYGMVSDKLDFDFSLELFDTYSGKDYFFIVKPLIYFLWGFHNNILVTTCLTLVPSLLHSTFVITGWTSVSTSSDWWNPLEHMVSQMRHRRLRTQVTRTSWNGETKTSLYIAWRKC